MSRTLEIFTDGACRGNPGPAGVGAVFKEDGVIVHTLSKAIGHATNNIAEYSALIEALEEAIELKADHLKLRTDSELMFKQIRGDYKVKNEQIKTLHARVMELLKTFKGVEFKHVPRKMNAEADKLATSSIKNFKEPSGPDGRPDVFHIGEESPSSKG